MVQHVDANSFQPALNRSNLINSGSANSSSSQAPGIASQSVPHAPETSAVQTESGLKAATNTGEASAQAPEPPDTSTVNTASVLQRMNETEMRVAVHSVDFGAVSIRAALSPQQMMAQISVDHGDLGKELSIQAPAMEARLANELGFRATVQVNQSAMAFSGGGGNPGQSDQGSFKSAAAQNSMLPALQTESDAANLSIDAGLLPAFAGNRSHRLDISA